MSGPKLLEPVPGPLSPLHRREEPGGKRIGHQEEEVAAADFTGRALKMCLHAGVCSRVAGEQMGGVAELRGGVQWKCGNQVVTTDLEEAGVTDRKRAPPAVRDGQ